jgi:excisionase family DNA binding protein
MYQLDCIRLYQYLLNSLLKGVVKVEKVLLTKEVAEMLRLSEEHVRELIRRRKIKAYKEGHRGGYRITMDEVKRYISRKFKEMEAGRG